MWGLRVRSEPNLQCAIRANRGNVRRADKVGVHGRVPPASQGELPRWLVNPSGGAHSLPFSPQQSAQVQLAEKGGPVVATRAYLQQSPRAARQGGISPRPLRSLTGFPAFLLVALAVAVVIPWRSAEASCGGNGQRACCFDEGDACGSGLTEINGCDSGCACQGAVSGFGFNAVSHCYQATACGGSGQRACCGGELIDGVSSCSSGLNEVKGCSGECTCGGSANPFAISSSGHCEAPTTACGNAGERACCGITGEGAPCGSGLTEEIGRA